LPLAVTVGVFDGVHRGHRALIRRVVEARGCVPTVVTFGRNPRAVLEPLAAGSDVMGLDARLAMLEGLGVALAVLVDFSADFRMMEGRDFLAALLGVAPVRLLVLGEDFRCGRGAGLGAQEIRGALAGSGTEVLVVPPVLDDGRPVSSSRVRLALAAGRTGEAERLLGWALRDGIAPH